MAGTGEAGTSDPRESPAAPVTVQPSGGGRSPGGGEGEPQGLSRVVVVGFARSRFIIILAVLGLLLSATAMLLYSAIATVVTVWDAFARGNFGADGAKRFSVDLVELTDTTLLGAVLYIVGLGLYELFIQPDLPVPGWLRFRSLSDLKAELVGVIIVLLGVSFLGYVVEGTGLGSILELGAAIAAVIVALSLPNIVGRRGHGGAAGAAGES